MCNILYFGDYTSAEEQNELSLAFKDDNLEGECSSVEYFPQDDECLDDVTIN